ncbi:MAG: hypothetical protein CSA51_00115 [Gammaproteobacteria bacterium]|nr:MAG: hypothetical protein CSA51_00115 [Gammaproteobacteria bacterium]
MAACTDAAPGELSAKQKARLVERVEQRWQAQAAKDWDKAWEFTTPNYRSVFPKELYRNNFSFDVDWELTGVDVLNYDAQAAVASVAARVMSSPSRHRQSASKLGTVPSVIREKWLLIDGEWWYSVRD